MDQQQIHHDSAARPLPDEGDFTSQVAQFVLQLRLIVIMFAAPAVLLFGDISLPSASADIAFFLGMAAVLDLAQLACIHTRLNRTVRSVFFSVAHVVWLGLALLVLGSLGQDGLTLPSLINGPAVLLFFAAVAFSAGNGPAFVPMVSAATGAALWLGLGMLAALDPGTAGAGSTDFVDMTSSMSGPLIGCALLLICGFVTWQSTHRILREADDVDMQRRRLDLLSHYVPPDMASRLSELEGMFDQVSEFDCAILLVDISHFQRKMEVNSVIESGRLIQEFHELVGEVVFKNGGVLRHMEGDSLYAVFGLLPQEKGNVERAVICAQTLAEAAKLWRSERIERGRAPADIYMGIDFGRCVIVPNAHPDRPDFSIIGSPFSASRRMERVARLVAADLAITGHAVHQLDEEGAGQLSQMLDHRGPQKVDDRRGVVEVRTWSLPLTSQTPVDNVA